MQRYTAFRGDPTYVAWGSLSPEPSDFCNTSRLKRIGAPSGPPSWRANGLLEPSGLQQRFWGLQRELFRPAERGSGASREPFKETFRCHKAENRFAWWALISTATDRGSSSTNQMHCRLDYFSTCLGWSPVGPAKFRALSFLQYLSAKTHRRAFGTAKLACKWPLGALWLAAALLGPAERAFQGRKARRDTSVRQS